MKISREHLCELVKHAAMLCIEEGGRDKYTMKNSFPRLFSAVSEVINFNAYTSRFNS